jgi:hypothetical protein
MAGKTAQRGKRRRKTSRRKTPAQRSGRRATRRYWSARVTKESNSLDLEPGVFGGKDPERIAASLKRSAEKSRRRKSDPYRSAMSMLVFYINRAGRKLPAGRKRVLERAKAALRGQFGRN